VYNLLMKIGALDKFSLIDYSGNTTAIIFTQGCNFRCPFCHNPELVLPEQFEEPIPFEDILAFLKKRKGLLDAVEFTGGEPTLQPDLIEKMQIIKGLGYKIKLDTNGTNPEVVRSAIAKNLVDYIAMDVKSSLEKYDEIAGVPVNKEKIKESLDLIKSSAPDYEFRTTLIRGFHDKTEMEKIGEIIRGAKRYYIQNAHFDKTVKPGFKRHPLTKETLIEFCEIVKTFDVNCEIRG